MLAKCLNGPIVLVYLILQHCHMRRSGRSRWCHGPALKSRIWDFSLLNIVSSVLFSRIDRIRPKTICIPKVEIGKKLGHDVWLLMLLQGCRSRKISGQRYAALLWSFDKPEVVQCSDVCICHSVSHRGRLGG